MSDSKPPVRFYNHLYIQVIIAVILAAILGYYRPDLAIKMKPIGDGFVRLIKMLIPLLIFFTIATGIANIQDIKKLGRVGIKTLVYFESISTFALLIGLAVVHLIQPGVGMNINPNNLNTQDLPVLNPENSPQNIIDLLIPLSIIEAFAKGNILHILLFSILFGITLAGVRDENKLYLFFDKITHAMFILISMLMKLSPLGAFGAMAYTVGKLGIETLLPLFKLMGCFYLTCLLFIFIVLGFICRYIGCNIFKLITYLREELLIVLGTASSESVFAQIMTKLQRLGCSKSIVNLVIPTGYSFNLDGTCIYLSIAVIFIAQATNTPISLEQEVMLFAVLLLTSKGAAGITDSGLVVLAATLSVIPTIPVEGVLIISGIDRFMSEARSLTNLIGNSVATLVAAHWEGELDHQRLQQQLDSFSKSKKQ